MGEIRYIKHAEIDFDKWDKAILSSVFPLVFAQRFYLNATHPGWHALVIGDYEHVFPLTAKTKFGISYLHQPPFTPQLGAYGKAGEEAEQKFYDYITADFKLIEIELNASNSLQTKEHSEKSTYIIDYKTGYKFNQNTKRNSAKALEKGLKVEQLHEEDILNDSEKYLSPFLRSELKLSLHEVMIFDNLLRAGIAEKKLVSFKVVDQGNTVKALAHFIYNGKHAVYLKGTNFDKAENSGSMHLLMSHAIKFFEDKSTLFDFGGGSKQTLATFYKGFGGAELKYKALKVNNLPAILKLFKS